MGKPPEEAATLRALHGATRRMIQAETTAELFDVVTDTAAEVLDFEYSTVRRYNPATEQLVPEAASTSLQQRDGEREPYDRSETVQWEAFDQQRIVSVEDVGELDDGVHHSESGSMIVIPIGEFGVVTIGSPASQEITKADTELASVFGANVEVALDRIEQLEELRARQRDLAEERDRLERFAEKVAHELRNPINVAIGHLKEYHDSAADHHLDAVGAALHRMEGLTEDVVALVKPDVTDQQPRQVPVASAARACWDRMETDGLCLEVTTTQTVTATPGVLEQIFENTFRNAVEHAGSGTTVTVGECSDGFYIADDGPGLDETIEQAPFAAGVSTVDHGAGLGLHVVAELCARQGWTVTATTSAADGARFEIHTDDPETDTHNRAVEKR